MDCFSQVTTKYNIDDTTIMNVDCLEDLDGDGIVDLLIQTYPSSFSYLLSSKRPIGNGDFDLEAYTIYLPEGLSDGTAQFLSDLNGDGQAEIFASNTVVGNGIFTGCKY